MAAPDFASVLAKLRRADQHADWLTRVITEFFGDSQLYEMTLRFNKDTEEIDVTGRYLQAPPVAYLGAVLGDALNCLRSALDHIVWGLSVRYHESPPPPHPIPPGNPWRLVGFPVVSDADRWPSALRGRLALVDPDLHARFQEFQPFVLNPDNPRNAWLQMLDDLWNIDKHRTVNIGKLTVALETVRPQWRATGEPIPCRFASAGPQMISLSMSEAEAYLGRLSEITAWPDTPEEMKMERGVSVNLFLDPSEPGLGKNLEFALGHMHNTVVLIAQAFAPEFT